MPAGSGRPGRTAADAAAGTAPAAPAGYTGTAVFGKIPVFLFRTCGSDDPGDFRSGDTGFPRPDTAFRTSCSGHPPPGRRRHSIFSVRSWLFTCFRKLDLAVKDSSGGSGHKDLVLLPVPADLQGAAQKMNGDRIAGNLSV